MSAVKILSAGRDESAPLSTRSSVGVAQEQAARAVGGAECLSARCASCEQLAQEIRSERALSSVLLAEVSRSRATGAFLVESSWTMAPPSCEGLYWARTPDGDISLQDVWVGGSGELRIGCMRDDGLPSQPKIEHYEQWAGPFWLPDPQLTLS